jgi:hypothetical protein
MADGGVLTMVLETKNASAQAGLVTGWWAPTLAMNSIQNVKTAIWFMSNNTTIPPKTQR